MMKKEKITVLIVSLLLLWGIPLAQENDVEGSQDHSLISRFADSVILNYDQREFDRYTLPLSKVTREFDKEGNALFKTKESKQLEGKITRIYYKAPQESTGFQIYKSYKEALKKADFEFLFEGSGRSELGKYFYGAVDRDKTTFFEQPRFELHFTEDSTFFIAAKRPGPKPVYVSLFIEDVGENPGIYQVVVEKKAMEKGLVTVSSMMEDFKNKGKTTIYGIYFDVDKAEIKPKSKPTLEKISKLLKEEPDLDLYVVGHTDNTGPFEHNMELSDERAQAVVEALISEYGIDGDRLKAVGVGPVCPVATNSTEDGRARNRRVALVKRSS